MSEIVRARWADLTRFTSARVALSRVGNSLTTRTSLEQELAQAQARDAVRSDLAVEPLVARLQAQGFEVVTVASAAANRTEYLMRPDRGRTLTAASQATIASLRSDPVPDLVFVVADGLSSAAIERHAAAFLEEFARHSASVRIGPVIVATQARVALGDPIGELLGAKSIAVLIGERPGSSSPDSMGVYYTFAPRPGMTDAQRNCISNIHAAGLSYVAAAGELIRLMQRAQQLGASGIACGRLEPPGLGPGS